MNAMDHAAKGDPVLADCVDGEVDPTILGRKSVLLGMAATMGLVIASAGQSSAAAAVVTATYAPTWVGSTIYKHGQQVLSPNNDVVAAKFEHTSSADYATDIENWALSSTYDRKNSRVWNVLDNGMTVGTNISIALQALITAVSAAGGGVVYFPAGLFYVGDVNLAANVSLQLDATAVLKMPNASVGICILRMPTGANNITISGGTLDGNRATYAGTVGRGISAIAARAVGLTVRGVNFINMAESGITLDPGICKIRVTDCSFVGMGLHAVLIYGGRDVEVNHNYVDRTGDPIVGNSCSLQFYVYSGNSAIGPRFTNNYIIGRTGTGPENALMCISWDVQPGGSCEGGVISGNTLLYGSMGISNARITNSVISGNHIEGAEYAGIEVAGSWGQTVSGNTINGKGTGHGIVVNGTGLCARMSIIGNTISNWGNTYSCAGIYVTELDGGVIANNTLAGTYTSTETIYLLNVLNSTISGNVIRTTSTNSGIHLIAGAVNCDSNVVSGNVITFSGTGWSSGHILLAANAGRQIKRTLIFGNNLKANVSGGYGVELLGADEASIIGTVVSQNLFSGFNLNLHEANATGTVDGSRVVGGTVAEPILASRIPLVPFIFGDAWARADAAALGSAESGQAWIIQAGVPGISRKQAYSSTAANCKAVLKGSADGFCEVALNALGSQAWMIFRGTDAGNYWRLGFSGGVLQLQKVVAGVAKSVGLTGFPPFAAGTRLGVICSKSSITASVDGVLFDPFTDAFNATGTLIGFQTADVTTRFGPIYARTLVKGR